MMMAANNHRQRLPWAKPPIFFLIQLGRLKPVIQATHLMASNPY
jgi:hypothetical protein